MAPHNYLVPLDGSKNAKAAFYTALSLLKPNDQLFLLCVVEDVNSFMNFTFGTDIETISPFLAAQEEQKEQGRLLLRKYAQICDAVGRKPTLLLGVSSHVGEMICKTIEEKHIHTVVMKINPFKIGSITHLVQYHVISHSMNSVQGRRGMSLVKRILVGSTSKYCIENAACNVLVVKGEWGPSEMHVDKHKIIELEEQERKERISEMADLSHWETAEKKLQAIHVAHEAADMAALSQSLKELFPVAEMTLE